MLDILLSLPGKNQSSSGNLTVETQAARLECVIVAWMPVGMTVCVFSTRTNSESGCGIDILSQSWTNPMHLLWAYGWLTLSQSCLPLVCLWDCKLVSAPMFMYGFLRTCTCDVFPQRRSISDAKIFVSDLFFGSGNSIPSSLSDDHLVWIWCLYIVLASLLETWGQ